MDLYLDTVAIVPAAGDRTRKWSIARQFLWQDEVRAGTWRERRVKGSVWIFCTYLIEDESKGK